MDDDRNKISAFAFVSPNAILGTGNVIMEGVIIRDNVVIGDNNYFGPYCIIGEVPEKRGYFTIYGKVRIGSNNRFEKQVTVDSGSENITKIGDGVLMLKSSHIGHDCEISDNVSISCNAAIGGFTKIGKGTVIGLNATVHQRLDVPEGCMLGMSSTITKKTVLAPFRKYVGTPARDIGENIR